MQPKEKPAPEATTARLEPGDLVNDWEAARILGLKVQTLRNWRCRKVGPPYRVIGACTIRYHRGELDAYTRARAASKAGAK